MGRHEKAIAGCTAPDQGKPIDAYLDRRMTPAEEDAYESHYFVCSACLQEITLRQALPEALAGLDAGQPAAVPYLSSRSAWQRWIGHPPVWWSAAAALAAVAIGAALAIHFSGGDHVVPSTETPIVLTLHGIQRGSAGGIDEVPEGRPLELFLFVPVPEQRKTTYDLNIVDPQGHDALQARDLQPTGLSQLRVVIPGGLSKPGRYIVRVMEKGVGGTQPLTAQFFFEVTEAGK